MSGQTDPVKRQGAETLWTPSNIITLLRICLVPLFVVALISPWPEWFGLKGVTDNQKSLLAAGIFIVISCTDWVDGYLARKRNEVTDFGKFMDPLADKILVAAALLALVQLQVLPSWPVLIILGREFIVSGIRMVAASKGVVIAASWYGKAKTVFQIIAIVLFLVKDELTFQTFGAAIKSPMYVISWVVMIIALVLTVLSMLDYLSKARHLLGFAPSKHGYTIVDEQKPVEVPEEPTAALKASIDGLAGRLVAGGIKEGFTVSCAESLTGGLISSAITSVSGSSAVLPGGVVSYTEAVKHAVLDVPSDVIETDGVVSEACVLAMANGARNLLKSDFAVAVSGIAGPTGAEPGKPVGTVWAAVATPEGERAFEYHFEGGREEVRLRTVEQALTLLCEAAGV